MECIATLFFGGIGGYNIIPGLRNSFELSNLHSSIDGEVIDIQPQNHSMCQFKYFVNGNQYLNQHNGGSCTNKKIGQQITVHYSPNDPSISTTDDPWEEFKNGVIPFSIAVLFFPIMAAVVSYHRKIWLFR